MDIKEKIVCHLFCCYSISIFLSSSISLSYSVIHISHFCSSLPLSLHLYLSTCLHMYSSSSASHSLPSRHRSLPDCLPYCCYDNGAILSISPIPHPTLSSAAVLGGQIRWESKNQTSAALSGSHNPVHSNVWLPCAFNFLHTANHGLTLYIILAGDGKDDQGLVHFQLHTRRVIKQLRDIYNVRASSCWQRLCINYC